ASAVAEGGERWRGDSRVVRTDDVCQVVTAATTTTSPAGAAPGAAHLPVEPERQFPEAALKDAAQRRAGSVSPYVMSSADFDLAFMTPVQIYAAQYQSERASRRELGADRRSPGIDGPFTRPVV